MNFLFMNLYETFFWLFPPASLFGPTKLSGTAESLGGGYSEPSPLAVWTLLVAAPRFCSEWGVNNGLHICPSTGNGGACIPYGSALLHLTASVVIYCSFLDYLGVRKWLPTMPRLALLPGSHPMEVNPFVLYLMVEAVRLVFTESVNFSRTHAYVLPGRLGKYSKKVCPGRASPSGAEEYLPFQKVALRYFFEGSEGFRSVAIFLVYNRSKLYS